MLRTLTIYHRWWKTWRTLPVRAWVKGASLYRAGRFQEAESFYREGLKRNPHHPARFSARLDLAFCLFKTGRLSESEEHLRYVTAHAPFLREGYIRLSRLQLWSGRPLEAAWTLRRSAKELQIDAELVAMFIISVLENGGPDYLLREAIALSVNLDSKESESLILETALARLDAFQGKSDKAQAEYLRILGRSDAPIEAIIGLAEILIEHDEIEEARLVLKRGIAMYPEYPRILSMIGQTYLRSGERFNADYARQLATSACQNSGWMSPREMHILAEAYYHLGDKIGALVIASKAKQAGSRLLGSYRDSKNLDRLIESLSTGTQA